MRALIIVMLIGVFGLCYFEMTFADITIDGETVHVETDNYEVQFDRGVITRLNNKLTGEIYTLPAEPSFRMPPAILGISNYFSVGGGTTIEVQQVNTHEAEILFRERGNEIRLRIGIDLNTGDLLISGDCVSDTPGVHGMQWGIENLDLDTLNLILPSDGGQIIDASSAIQHKNFNYPSTHWEAQLAIIQAEYGGFYVRGTDITFQFKSLEYKSDAGSFGLGFRTENQAPWDTLISVKSITWRLNTYSGDYRVPARIYRDWMEVAFNPWRLTNMPAWVGDIGLVVIHNNLDAKMLEGLAELVDPTKTLLYLTEWRKDKHDVNWPDYTPKEELGDFVEAAHRHGFRLMLHVNIYGFSTYHSLYPEFQRFQLRRPSGKLVGWKWAENDSAQRHAHISLASSKFRNLLVQRWKTVWEKYNVDAFHLDVSHRVVNDANGLIEGLNSAQGNVLMHTELAAAMPGIVFSGEYLHEVTFFRESFAQRETSNATAHPISAFLFVPYTRSYGHLGILPIENDPPAYHTYLNSYESRGILPTLRISSESNLNGPFTRQMLSIARQWQDLGLTPDFESDWGTDTLFQYRTQTGETVTYQRTPAGSTLTLPNNAGYERVFGTTQVQTHRSLPHWRAYNETTLLGLDPNRYYFLNNTPRDFSQLRINSLSPDVYINETRVTNQAALFRLKSTSSGRYTTIGFFLPTEPVASIPDILRSTGPGQYTLEVDLSKPVVFFRGFLQQVSLPYNLSEAQFITGIQTIGPQLDNSFRLESIHGSGTHRTVTIDNIKKETIFAHPPARGQTILQFPLLLAEEPSTFSFSVGLEEGCSKGVLFQVRLNGQVYSEIFTDTFDWKEGKVSLSAFAGQPVLLELVTDPANSGLAGADCDWAHWADLYITAASTPA